MCLSAGKLWGSGGVVVRVLEVERDPCSGQNCISHQDSLLETAQTIMLSPRVGFRACPGSHPPGWGHS